MTGASAAGTACGFSIWSLIKDALSDASVKNSFRRRLITVVVSDSSVSNEELDITFAQLAPVVLAGACSYVDHSGL
jgi:hypothetical protein